MLLVIALAIWRKQYGVALLFRQRPYISRFNMCATSGSSVSPPRSWALHCSKKPLQWSRSLASDQKEEISYSTFHLLSGFCSCSCNLCNHASAHRRFHLQSHTRCLCYPMPLWRWRVILVPGTCGYFHKTRAATRKRLWKAAGSSAKFALRMHISVSEDAARGSLAATLMHKLLDFKRRPTCPM